MADQLYKKQNLDKVNLYPKTYTDNIVDKEGHNLTEILQGFNCYFLSYTGDVETTRLSVPSNLRKQGLWVTYVDYKNNTITEYYNGINIDDNSFKDSSNWRKGNNTLVGNLSISANGNWVIDNKETEFKAQGETGTTPLIRFSNNKFQVSYNEGKYWENITGDVTNQLKISKYIGADESLPTSGIAEGTIYMKGPFYKDDDTLLEYPSYRMYIYAWKDNTLAWQDNGEFTSVIVGVVNDLTTGGADKALSAEMGKEIALVANKVVEKSITIVSQDVYEPLQLDFPIPRGSYISVEGDFNIITCRTNHYDSDYQRITGSGIADRDITYIKMNGTGTATLTVKGPIVYQTEQNKEDIATKTLQTNESVLNLKIAEGYIQDTNLVPYPARRNGAQQVPGEDFKGYEIALEDAYTHGFKFIKFRASSRDYNNNNSTAILPAIVLDKAGAVESLIETESDKVKTTAWYILPITENSKTLRATYADGKTYPDTKLVPYKYELLTELPPQVVDYSNAIENLNTEITGLKKAEGLDIYLIPGNFPARKDGSTTSSGTYKGYEVNVEEAFAKGYRFIKVRAASYWKATSDSSIVPCLIYDKDNNVESVITEFETMTTDWYILPITKNSSKVRCSYAKEPFIQGGNTYPDIVFEPYKIEFLVDNELSSVEDRVKSIEDSLENIASLVNTIDIFLPSEINVLKGRTTQLFFRGFIKAVDPYVYDIKVQCAVGKTYKRYYEIEHNTTGNFPFKIEVRDDNKRVLGVAETTIKIIEPASISSKNILCCGASATETGHWAAELKRLLTTGSEKYSGLNLPMTFVGRKVGSSDKSVQLEATGGWTWSTFISAGVPAVRFYVTGMTGNIGIGTKLTLNDAEKGTLQYSVLEVNLTEGIGNIRCGEAYPNPVVIPSSTSGKLTGDSISITYNNVVEEKFTPFYNAETGEVDFKTYANNYCNGNIDILVTHMGVNSVLTENSSTPTASIKAFLDGYFKDFPRGKVLVSAIPFPDYGTNIYTNTYKENNTNRYGSLCSFFDYNKNLYEISQLDEYRGKVVYCPSNVFFDTDYGYPKKDKDVNTRIVAIKESIDTNGVHPIKEGSYLISDSILPTIITDF